MGCQRARPRGYLIDPATLIYATGGAAWLHFEATATCNSTAAFGVSICAGSTFIPNSLTNSHTKVGWTAGAGIEGMLTRNWLARIEYRYADFGTVTDRNVHIVAPPTGAFIFTYDLRVRTHTALLGLSYRFDWFAPVVASY